MSDTQSFFVLDPAWKADSGGGGKGANDKYDLHDVDAMAYEYRRSEPWSDVSPALMFMWSTTSAHREGDDRALMRALSFTPSAEWIWVKGDACAECGGTGLVSLPVSLPTVVVGQLVPRASIPATCITCRGVGCIVPTAKLGLGQYQDTIHEYLTLCRRNFSANLPLEQRPRSVIFAPRGEHSEKPEKAWLDVIEVVKKQTMPDVVGVEYNCRRRRPGWSAVGRLDGEKHPIRYERAPR